MLHQTQLAQIVAQASTIFERLQDDRFIIDTTQNTDSEISDRILEQWCQKIAQGDENKFQKRLSWQGWTLEKIKPYLGSVCLRDPQNLPDWAKTLNDIIEITAVAAQIIPATEICFPDSEPQAFADIFQGILYLARYKLFRHLDENKKIEYEQKNNSEKFRLIELNDLPLGLLSSPAYLTLEYSLLKKLSQICEQTLEQEFNHFRPLGQSLLSRMLGQSSGTENQHYYHKFIKNLLQDGLLAFFANYPVLAKLVAITVDMWVETTGEFIQHLNQDGAEIQNIFNIGNFSSPQVIAVNPGLSDAHQKGRSVIALTFADGNQLIYKPKNLGIERAFQEFLTWCNQESKLLDLKTLKILDKTNYGWVEVVEHLPCQSEIEAKYFYQRIGMLLCILYTFGGIDFHCENLIANSEYPVLIDIETLMHPETKLMDDTPSDTDVLWMMSQQLWNSCLRTGMLPRWDFSQNEQIAFDVSALGNIQPQQAPSPVKRWKLINTDDMHLADEKIALPSRKNTAILNQEVLSPINYLESIVLGFEQMYMFLLSQRDYLLQEHSILTIFQSQKLRFIFRATHIYSAILQKTFSPQLLHNGVNYSLTLDAFTVAFLGVEQPPHTWAIAEAEQQALLNLIFPILV